MRCCSADVPAPCSSPPRQPPPPRGPLLGEAEKARCALLMQHRGRPPAPPARDRGSGDGAPPPDAAAPCGAAPRPRGELGRLQARFDALAAEVAEREAWAAGMAAAGLARPGHAAVIRGEVAERAAAMARLDGRMRQLEGGLAGGGGCNSGCGGGGRG
jgi:hypothetical protein